MSFLQAWKDAKEAFESATDKKKPSAKFLGVFNKSSGLETACKELDSALANPTGDKLAKAEQKYVKAYEDYMKVLQKAAKDEGKSADYKAEAAKLEKALEQITLDFSKAKQDHLATAPQRFEDIVPSEIIDGLAKSKFPNGPGIKAFLTDKKFAQSGHDGTPLDGAATAQREAAECLRTYVAAMKAMAAERKTVYERQAAWKKAYDICTDAACAIDPVAGGFLEKWANWSKAQEAAFQEGGKQEVYGDWLKNGPLADKIKLFSTELKDEQVRMNKLSVICDKYRG